MNFKKTKVAVASGLMAASMVLAPLAAYADTWSEDKPALDSAKIVKTVKVADGVTIDNDVTFKLTQIHNTKDGDGGVVAPNETVDGTTSTFTEIIGISTGVNGNGVTYANGEYTVKALTKNHKDSDVDTNGNQANDKKYIATTTLDFSEAKIGNEVLKNGVYTFEVEETWNDLKIAEPGAKADADKYGWTVDASKYILTVYVSTVDKERKVEYSILEDKTSGHKKESADFTNKFTKQGGQDDNKSSLVIKKEVNDTTYLAAGQKFKFTISFDEIEYDRTDTVTVTEAQATNAKIYGSNDEVVVNTNAVTKNDDGTYSFELENGQYIAFADIPAGVKYTATETVRTNTSKTNVSTGSNMPAESATDAMEISGELITEKGNIGNFKNYLKNITITGVVTHSAPFVIMVGALFVAVGGYVVLKKRIEE